MKKNNKGYMLVEIILASAIAFGVAFFILSLIMKLKTKNDDLLVDTVVNTDRTIITNKLMSQAMLEGRLPNEEAFDCNELKIIDGKTIEYRGKIIDTIDDIAEIDQDAIKIINDYKTIMNDSKETAERKAKAKSYCNNEMGVIHINIPIKVKQMPNKNYDINIDYKYQIGDQTGPTGDINLVVENNKLRANITNLKDELGNGEHVVGYYLSPNEYECSDTLNFIESSEETYLFKDEVLGEKKYQVCAKVKDDLDNFSFLTNTKDVTCGTYNSCNKCNCASYGQYVCTKDDYTVYLNSTCYELLGNGCISCTPYNGSITHSKCVTGCKSGYAPCNGYERCSKCGCEIYK